MADEPSTPGEHAEDTTESRQQKHTIIISNLGSGEDTASLRSRILGHFDQFGPLAKIQVKALKEDPSTSKGYAYIVYRDDKSTLLARRSSRDPWVIRLKGESPKYGLGQKVVRPCYFFQTGFCRNGQHCQFGHGDSDSEGGQSRDEQRCRPIDFKSPPRECNAQRWLETTIAPRGHDPQKWLGAATGPGQLMLSEIRKHQQRANHVIVVRNLADDESAGAVHWQILDHFRPFGRFTIRVKTLKQSPTIHRGYAFVCFFEEESALHARQSSRDPWEICAKHETDMHIEKDVPQDTQLPFRPLGRNGTAGLMKAIMAVDDAMERKRKRKIPKDLRSKLVDAERSSRQVAEALVRVPQHILDGASNIGDDDLRLLREELNGAYNDCCATL